MYDLDHVRAEYIFDALAAKLDTEDKGQKDILGWIGRDLGLADVIRGHHAPYGYEDENGEIIWPWIPHVGIAIDVGNTHFWCDLEMPYIELHLLDDVFQDLDSDYDSFVDFAQDLHMVRSELEKAELVGGFAKALVERLSKWEYFLDEEEEAFWGAALYSDSDSEFPPWRYYLDPEYEGELPDELTAKDYPLNTKLFALMNMV